MVDPSGASGSGWRPEVGDRARHFAQEITKEAAIRFRERAQSLIDGGDDLGAPCFETAAPFRRRFDVDPTPIARIAAAQHVPLLFEIVEQARYACGVLRYGCSERRLAAFAVAHQMRKELPSQDRFSEFLQLSGGIRPHDTARAPDEKSQLFDEVAVMAQSFAPHWTREDATTKVNNRNGCACNETVVSQATMRPRISREGRMGWGGAIGVMLTAMALPASAQSKGGSEAPKISLARDTEVSGERISLASALTRAQARNVTMVVATQEIQRAEALVREARAGSLPTLTGNGIYTRLDADREFAGRRAAARDQLSANLNLTVPLFVPQRWAQWSHARANAETARAAAEDTRRQVAIAVARAYLAVISQKRVIDVGERALATAKAHYEYAHTRFTGGIGNRVDAVRAEQEVATDEAQVEAGYAGLARAREALGVLVGEQGPLDTEDEIALARGPDFEVALRDASSTRRDIVASRSRLEAAEQVKKNSYADYLPFLVATVQPFYQNPPTIVQPLTGWQAQLLLTIPFYDGGLRYGLAAEREALSNEARSQYEALVRQARSDVRVAFESVKRAEAALVAATNAARLAKSALDLATIAYQAGATTNLEVIDAERRARDAETAAAVAEDNARQARVDLLAASGRFP